MYCSAFDRQYLDCNIYFYLYIHTFIVPPLSLATGTWHQAAINVRPKWTSEDTEPDAGMQTRFLEWTSAIPEYRRASTTFRLRIGLKKQLLCLKIRCLLAGSCSKSGDKLLNESSNGIYGVFSVFKKI